VSKFDKNNIFDGKGFELKRSKLVSSKIDTATHFIKNYLVV
jgi:hypothetical protein